MGKMKYILVLILGSLLLSSCEGFLDREPLDQISTGNFYKSETDARLAVLSVYSTLQSINWHGKSWMITEIPSDNTTTGGNDPDFSPIDNFTINSDNAPNSEYWTEHYRLVTQANQVIQFVPEIEMDAVLKANYVGEARFLRAFSYFDLVRIYGDVPIITEVPTIDSDLYIPRSPVAEVYEMIEADLLYAIENLPESRTTATFGRATMDAAKALLAKAYLTQNKNEDCMTLCREIIADGRYRLEEDFANNWLRDISDNNSEAIFQIQYVGWVRGIRGMLCKHFLHHGVKALHKTQMAGVHRSQPVRRLIIQVRPSRMLMIQMT